MDEDNDYQGFEIIDNNLKQISIYGDILDFENDLSQGKSFICPECGKQFRDFIEDMGGFCKDCVDKF